MGDRNLFIYAASVGETDLEADRFEVFDELGAVLEGRNGLLTRNGEVAVASPPTEGWLSTAGGDHCSGSIVVSGFANGQVELQISAASLREFHPVSWIVML